MKSLYESILDTDKQIRSRINKQVDRIRYINDYIDLVKKELGKYVDKKESKKGLFFFPFDAKDEVLKRVEKFRSDKIPGFKLSNNNPSGFVNVLKSGGLLFEWDLFFNINDKGWSLMVMISEDSKDLQDYVNDLLKEKLL